MLEIPTRALRSKSPQLLGNGLQRLLVARETQWLRDERDLLVALAPFHDCATRLGLDLAGVFDQAAAHGPRSVAELVQSFGRRTDITPEAFGFGVTDTPAGLNTFGPSRSTAV